MYFSSTVPTPTVVVAPRTTRPGPLQFTVLFMRFWRLFSTRLHIGLGRMARRVAITCDNGGNH